MGSADAAGRTEKLGTDDEAHDHGSGAEADGHELVHDGQPPRADEDPLSCVFDAIANRVERRVGQLGRSIQKEGLQLSVEVVPGGHASRSWDVADALASASRAARSARFA